MNRLMLFAFAIFVLVAGFACSNGGGNPATPEANPSLSPQTATNAGNSQTHLWGYYSIYIDPATQTAVADLSRNAMFAANVVNFLNGKPADLGIKINGTNPEATYIDVDLDVTITHPFPGLHQYDGYDIRGVFMGDGSGTMAYNPDLKYPVLGTDQSMLPDPLDGFGGPDGYTRWFNRTEFSEGSMLLLRYTPGVFASNDFAGDATLCPYKYFADGLGKNDDVFQFLATTSGHGVFSAGAANTRNYYLRFPNTKGIRYGYAVVANWEDEDTHPANAPEAQEVKATVTDNIWYVDPTHKGGNLILDLDVFAWNTAPNSEGVMDDYTIIIDSTVLSTPHQFMTSEMTPTGGDTYSTYHAEIPADNITGTGGNEFWVIVESAGHDYSNPFGFPNLAETDPLAAIFRYELTVLSTQVNNPPNITGIEDVVGSGHYDHMVTVDDVKTYYVIYTDPDVGQTHTITWYLVNDGGTPTLADTVTMPIDWGAKGEGDYDIYVDVSDGVDTTQGGPFDVSVVSGHGNAVSFGGTGTQYALGFCVDSTGAKYSGGYFFGDTNLDPAGNDPHPEDPPGAGGCMWLNKLNADGTFAWGYTWPGTGGYHSYVWGIVPDNQGHKYVCGHFVFTIDFDPGSGVDNHTASNNSGRLDAFLMKFDTNGKYIWGESWGNTTENVTAFDIVNYNDQYLYVTGYYPDKADIDPTSGVDIRDANSDTGLYNIDNAYMIKVDLDGKYIWGRTWGWNATLYGYEVTVDGSGNPIATGDIEGTGDLDPTSGVQTYVSKGWSDTYVIKFLADGTWQWSRAFGGNSWDITNALVADASGGIYFCGGSSSTDAVDFDPGPGEALVTMQGSYDGYLVKYDSSGAFQWVDMFGEPSHDNTWCMTLDDSGDILMGGHFSDTIDLDPGPGVDSHTPAGGSDSYLVKIHPDGSFGWGASWGSPGYDSPEGVDVEPNGMIDVAGNFEGTGDFDPGPGVFNLTSNGAYNTYIDMFLPNGGW